MSMRHFDCVSIRWRRSMAARHARRSSSSFPGWINLFLVVWLLASGPGFSQTAPAPNPLSRMPMENCEGTGQTLDVKAERMTFERQSQTFLFQDNVRVRRCDMTILCDRLRVYNDDKGQRVERIEFIGNVRMQQGDRHVTADHAEYFDAEQKLVLTGNPKAWDTAERNELTGEEIVVFLQEDRLMVKQAHVRFHPRQQLSRSP